MVKKLRHLSIVSLAAKCKQIPYSLLLKELDMPNVRELEDLIIEAIYAGLIKARMDQNEQKLEVYYAMGRDVEMSKLPELLGIVFSLDWILLYAVPLVYLNISLPYYFKDILL